MEDGVMVFIFMVVCTFVLIMVSALSFDAGRYKLQNCVDGDQIMHQSVVYECTPVFELEKR